MSRSPLRLRRLVIGLAAIIPALMGVAPAAAQTAAERTLVDFTQNMLSCFGCSMPPIVGSDGALYGTTPSGGAYNWGTLYRMSAGKGFQVLHDFGESVVSFEPVGAPVQLANGDLYGVTSNPTAGRKRPGALWRYTHNGEYQVLDRFRGPNGFYPNSLMATADGRLFGTTFEGGNFGKGTLFQVDETGHARTVHSFSDAGGAVNPDYAPVLASDHALYGIALHGGSEQYGAIWRFGADGRFSVVHSFGTGADNGTWPSSKLIQGRDGALYGMTNYGPGPEGFGTLYRITLDGVYQTIHVFGGADGAYPVGGLTEDAAGNLLGATESGSGPGTVGTAFSLAPDGALTTLHAFAPAHDGQFPNGLTLGANGKAWGLAAYGGAHDDGTLWQLTLP